MLFLNVGCERAQVWDLWQRIHPSGQHEEAHSNPHQHPSLPVSPLLQKLCPETDSEGTHDCPLRYQTIQVQGERVCLSSLFITMHLWLRTMPNGNFKIIKSNENVLCVHFHWWHSVLCIYSSPTLSPYNKDRTSSSVERQFGQLFQLSILGILMQSEETVTFRPRTHV